MPCPPTKPNLIELSAAPPPARVTALCRSTNKAPGVGASGGDGLYSGLFEAGGRLGNAGRNRGPARIFEVELAKVCRTVRKGTHFSTRASRRPTEAIAPAETRRRACVLRARYNGGPCEPPVYRRITTRVKQHPHCRHCASPPMLRRHASSRD
jgi:hypothetical protein